MKELFMANLGNIIVLVLVLAVIVIGLLLGKKTFVKAFVRGLVVKAEQLYGSKTGQIKREAVLGWIYQKAPLLALFLTPEDLDKLIKDAVTWLKLQLATPGVNLLSYAQEQQAKLPATNMADDKSKPPNV
jgi:hypothetical protein